MIFQGKDNVRLTKSELNVLRKRNAENGQTIDEVRTTADLAGAIIGGLSHEQTEALHAFLEGDSLSSEKEDPIHQG